MIFRYPGGKTRLLKEIIPGLLRLDHSGDYYEPFVGGGSVACRIAKDFRGKIINVNDADPWIYSFWKLFELDSDSDFYRLFSMINTAPTIKKFLKLRGYRANGGTVDLAYKAIFFNRTTFSGIASAGPIGGIMQKSKWKIDCRYNPKLMISKINEMRALFRSRIRVSNLHFIDFIKKIPQIGSFIYADPPYYKKGRDLYNIWMNENEHIALSRILHRRRNWLLSYDDSPVIRALYAPSGVRNISVRYSSSGGKKSWKNGNEFLISG